MPKVVEEAWTLMSADITAFGVIADEDGPNRYEGTSSQKWSDIWCYQVPTGTALILRPSHHFSALIHDQGGATASGGCRLKIEVRDQSQGDSKAIFGPAMYESCSEFQDRDKMATLDLQSDFAVEEKMWICIMCYIMDDYHDESACIFKLETVRIRSGV